MNILFRIFILLICTQSTTLFSQVTTQLIMNNRPSPYLSDWGTQSQTFVLIVNNLSGAPVDCKIMMQLYKGSGDMLAETSIPKLPIITIGSGITQFHADEICHIPAIKYYGTSQTAIIETGKLQDDNYRLCVSLLNPTTSAPLNNVTPQCGMFTIAAYQAPTLISPRNGEEILESNVRGIIFRWTPVVPDPNFIVTYRLQVWELLDGQNNVTAIRTNQPIVEKDYKGQTQTVWPVDFALPEVGKKYAWAITPFDDQERKLVDGIGMSAPFGFSVLDIHWVPNGEPRPDQKSKKPVPGHHAIVLISPLDGSEVSGDVIFSWKDTLPVPQDGYTLSVVEIIDEQSAEEAMKNNKPIYLKEGITTTSTEKISLPIKNPQPKGSRKYKFAWQVSSGVSKSGVGTFKGETKVIIVPPVLAQGRNPNIAFIAQDSKISSALSYKLLITNNVTDTINIPQGIRISSNNDSIIYIDDNLSNDWKRTPSKFPPGSNIVTWIYNSGKIPLGETNLGNVQFVIPGTNTFYVAYEWIDKSGKTIYKDSVMLNVNEAEPILIGTFIISKNANSDNVRFNRVEAEPVLIGTYTISKNDNSDNVRFNIDEAEQVLLGTFTMSKNANSDNMAFSPKNNKTTNNTVTPIGNYIIHKGNNTDDVVFTEKSNAVNTQKQHDSIMQYRGITIPIRGKPRPGPSIKANPIINTHPNDSPMNKKKKKKKKPKGDDIHINSPTHDIKV